MTKGIGALAAVALTAFAANTAVAQENAADPADQRGYVNILPFYFSADANRRGTSEDGRGISGGYGKQTGDRWYTELNTFAGVIANDQPGVRDFYNYGLGMDFNFHFRRGEGWSPYLLLGGGVVRNDVVPDSDTDNDWFANVGLGFVSGPLGDGEIRLRSEVRYIRDRQEVGTEGYRNDRRFAIGFQIPVGRRIVEVEREVVRETTVRETVPADITDSDNDGVPDQNDRCPGTLQGLLTDNRGCASTSPQTQTVRLEGVNFELNSATLTSDASAILRRVADALEGEPNLRAEIAGHTDSSGTDEYNQRLSQERANSVLQFLLAQGIDRSRLQARGYGEGQPVADNASPAGRERNRRVEFQVLN